MSEKFRTQSRSAINADNISKYLKDSGVGLTMVEVNAAIQAAIADIGSGIRPFVNSEEYELDEVVLYQDSLWVCKRTFTSNDTALNIHVMVGDIVNISVDINTDDIPSLAVAYGNEFPDTESLPIGYRFTLKDSVIEVDDGIYIWSGYSWVQELAL
jgi:hypothetical protein